MARSQPCAEIQSLERRQLLAGFVANINFQPRGTVPSGYVADTGRIYADQNGLTYGWDRDNGHVMSDRHSDAKQRYDTLAAFGNDGQAKTWQIAVPSGLYKVKVLAGDAKYTNSTYAMRVEDSTILNRTPNKASRWRRGEGLVFVTDGKLTLTSASGSRNNKIDSIDIEQVDPHATGVDIVNPASLSGIVQNEVPTGEAIPMLDAIGARSVKLWYEVTSWDDAPNAWDYKNISKYKAAGFNVTVSFVNPNVSDPADVKSFFERIVAYKDFTKQIDFWEIGNEPNHPYFWDGTPTQFVQDYMRPAYEVLKPLGEPTIGGGVTFDANYCAQLQAVGYSDFCDYAGFHPYGPDAAEVIARATEAKAAFEGKPMILTEWNVIGSRYDTRGWGEQIKIAADGLKSIAYLNFFYGLKQSPGNDFVGFLYLEDGSKNDELYNAVAAIV